MTRRRALWMMGGVAGSLALHACSQSTTDGASDGASSEASSSSDPVSASTGSTLWIGYVPLFVALEKGFFTEAGLKLDYNVFGASTEGDAAFAAKKIDGVNNVTSEAVALFSRGQDFRIIQVADTSLGGDGILARNSITDLADFKGKEIAVDVGGVSHFFLLQVLKEAGLEAGDISISNLTPDAAAAAYQAGRVDVAVTYAPFLQKANEAQPDGRVIFDTSQMPTAIVDVYIFSPEFVEQTPDAAQAYVDGIFKGREFLETNKDEALEISAKWLELSPEEVEQELTGVDLTSPEDNAKMLGDSSSDLYLVPHMTDLAAFLIEQGQIESEPTAEQFEQVLESKFVEAAIA
ncbi:MAG: ABC transporter substrate-binding protein [Leptolyngbyaceae bacterium]|nr:ABC transporter substrate-binding protein [Leptolyngbyaceae bacterium]